jgi:WD40 repeat protein/serine/threonine protein kinase
MSAEEITAEDERCAALLAACHEALLAGETSTPLTGPEVAPELRARLERDLACLRLLDQARPQHDAASQAHTPTSPNGPSGTDLKSVPVHQLPTTIGRFRIRRELGHGGYGIVFQAYDPQLEREIALKVPHVEALLTPELRERFLREARAAAALDHPNLVPVYDAGEVGPVCYIASAYCPGTTLAAWLKARAEPVPWQQAAVLVATLADAVHHAHAQGVVHRDLKPANVLLARNPKSAPCSLGRNPKSGISPVEGQAISDTFVSDFGFRISDFVPKITDFGLAKFQSSEPGSTAPQDLTKSGAIVGTPRYMAPEQAGGNSEAVGPAADIHALGAILYEVLTGRPPFVAETVLDTLEQVRSQEPLAPRRLRPKLPRDLETICLRCLQKEPRKRYASAAELAEDLKRFLAGQPIRARPVRAWERVAKWARRRPAAAALVAVSSMASVLLVIGLVVANVLIADALRDKGAALAREKEALEISEQTSARNAVAAAEREFATKNWGQGEEFLLKVPEKLRNWWEWRYLMRLRHIDPISLPVGKSLSTAEGFDLAFHPEGRLLAVPSSNNSIQVVDASNGEIVWDLHSDEGGEGRVRSVAFSPPDGRFLVSGSDDKSVTLWDTTTGKPLWTRRHGGPVQGVAFSPNGKRLASVGRGINEPGEVKVWDAATGDLFHTFPGQAAENPVVHVAFSPDSRWLAGGSGDNTDHTVKVWDVTTGEEVYTLSGHTDWIINVIFTPDGLRLVSVSRDRWVNVWDLPPRKPEASAAGARRLAPRWSWKSGNNSPRCMALSPDGSRLAVGGPTADGSVRVYDMATGELKHRLMGDYRTVSVGFSPNGQRVVSAGYDRNVRLWDTTTGHQVLSLRGHDDIVGHALFSPDGQRIAAAVADGTVMIWDANAFDEKSQPHIRTIGGHDGEFYGLDFSPDRDSPLLASASTNGSIELWDPATGKLVWTAHPGHKEPAVCVVFSPNGMRLLSGSMDRTAKLWDANNGHEIRTLDERFKVMVWCVAFHPEGKVFATASHRELGLWDAEDGRSFWRQKEADSELVNGVAFSPDGKYVATVGNPSAVVWNVANGDVTSRFMVHQRTVHCVAFHPNANYLASGDADKKIHLWAPDSPFGRTIHPPLSGHTESVKTLAFSRDGKYLASASWKEVIVWDVSDVNSIKKRETFDRIAGRIWRVAFSPDGKRLAACGGYKGTGEIKIWDATLWEK